MGFKRRSLPEPTVNMSIIQSFAHLKTISCRVPNFDGSKEICNVPPEFALRFMGWVFAIQKLFFHGGPSPFMHLLFYPTYTGQDGRKILRDVDQNHQMFSSRSSFRIAVEMAGCPHPQIPEPAAIKPHFLT